MYTDTARQLIEWCQSYGWRIKINDANTWLFEKAVFESKPKVPIDNCDDLANFCLNKKDKHLSGKPNHKAIYKASLCIILAAIFAEGLEKKLKLLNLALVVRKNLVAGNVHQHVEKITGFVKAYFNYLKLTTKSYGNFITLCKNNFLREINSEFGLKIDFISVNKVISPPPLPKSCRTTPEPEKVDQYEYAGNLFFDISLEEKAEVKVIDIDKTKKQVRAKSISRVTQFIQKLAAHQEKLEQEERQLTKKKPNGELYRITQAKSIALCKLIHNLCRYNEVNSQRQLLRSALNDKDITSQRYFRGRLFATISGGYFKAKAENIIHEMIAVTA